MMHHNAHGFSRHTCRLIAVLCGKFAERGKEGVKHRISSYPFPELVSSGRLEVQTLVNPTVEAFQDAQKALRPNILYFQGEQIENEEEIGMLIWASVDMSDPQNLSTVIGPSLPTIVYLEIPNGEKIAQALLSMGIPYVIYWKNSFSSYSASHFRQALLSVVQSSYSHIWDAFQLAHASFRLYCIRNNFVLPADDQKGSDKLGPRLMGDAPKINIIPMDGTSGEEENLADTSPSIKIYNDDVDMRFLVCGLTCTLDACLLGALEDGLNALLNIEIRGSKLRSRAGAAPPPFQAGELSRGVITMRCELTTCSSAHISLLVSGSAQICFDDQLLESHVKNEIIEKNQLVHAFSKNDESKSSFCDPLPSVSIACGASVFEVWMKLPSWAAQVLKQLAPEVSYHSLVTLGIACIQGTSVASFERDDADRLLFFCPRQTRELCWKDDFPACLPAFSSSLTRKRQRPISSAEHIACSRSLDENFDSFLKDGKDVKKAVNFVQGTQMPSMPVQKSLRGAALRPIPHLKQQKMMPFSGVSEADAVDRSQMKPHPSTLPLTKHNIAPSAPIRHKKSMSSSYHPIVPLNPLPMKKHGCNRSPIQVCSEEEFLMDVMQFLILRGHSRLVPEGGISEFPDVILNAKRLDLFNLYREVVSRGGFYVGNGINWKGQVFSKMRNHTVSNRMTGVGNALKRHYQTFLLEYELAHDDVDGECCLLCHSGAPGDWVNCGLCGEWAHFGCDTRQSLATFKDYAKTDGLEYICPNCSLTNSKKKLQKVANGYSNSTALLRHV